MKKLFFALACVIGLMTFASCDPEAIDEMMEQKPDVEIMAEDGFISTNTSVYVGTELLFKVRVAPNSSSESPLTKLDFDITDPSLQSAFHQSPEITNPNGENVFTFSYTPERATLYAATATLKDEAGKINTVVVTIDYVEPVEVVLGEFRGTVDINGHVTAPQAILGQNLDEDVNLNDLDAKVLIGNTVDGKTNLTIDIDGTPVTFQCTIDENGNLVFDEFHFYRTISVLTAINVNLDITVNMNGTLIGDELTVHGQVSGSGRVDIPLTNIVATFTGEINGTLNKVAE